jgi:O-acetyl-ADP-ribose deacetylase (regulator of RNase III)
MRIESDDVTLATRGALKAAGAHGLTTIAIPGMGTGIGGIACSDAANRMVNEITTFQPRALRSIVLVDINPEMVDAWHACLKANGKKLKGKNETGSATTFLLLPFDL